MRNTAMKFEQPEEQQESDEIIKIDEVRKRLNNLMELCEKKQDAQKSYITARLSDKVDQNQQKAVQLSLLVDEFGR